MMSPASEGLNSAARALVPAVGTAMPTISPRDAAGNKTNNATVVWLESVVKCERRGAARCTIAIRSNGLWLRQSRQLRLLPALLGRADEMLEQLPLRPIAQFAAPHEYPLGTLYQFAALRRSCLVTDAMGRRR